MTIRSRLLFLLLPTLTALVALIALFFYFNWSHEILNSFTTRLQSVVIATSQTIKQNDIEWIQDHINDPNLQSEPRYQQIRSKLSQLKQQLPIDNLYIIQIEPLKDTDLVSLNSSKTKNEEVDNGYKQVFLLDASRSPEKGGNIPGDIDFSESEEHKIYFTKKAFVTPIYESRKTGERFMTAYAPILNAQDEVIALLGADVSMREIDQKLQNAILAIFLSTLISLLMVMMSVFLIAHKISKPVQQLNQAALDIAAGNYEANIKVDGPREIVELANTFNTMSECLVENISRLREGSLIRERMYGEYECSLLLQYYMLQKQVEDFQHPHVQIRLTSVNFSNIQKGLLLKLKEKTEPDQLELILLEAHEKGFESLYELTSKPLEVLKSNSFIDCIFKNNYSLLEYQTNQLFAPLVWSVKSQMFIKGNSHQIPLQDKDMIFIYNSGLTEQFNSEEKVENWLSKVLRHFSEDGLETIHTMLTNELNFLVKRENLKENIQILSIQVNLP